MGIWGNKGKEKKCPDTSGTQTLVTPDQEARVLTIRPPVPIPVVNILCINKLHHSMLKVRYSPYVHTNGELGAHCISTILLTFAKLLFPVTCFVFDNVISLVGYSFREPFTCTKRMVLCNTVVLCTPCSYFLLGCSEHNTGL